MTNDRHRTRVHPRRWLTVLTAMAAATATWAVAEALLGIDLAVGRDPQTVRQVGSLAVTLASLSAGLAGWALLAALERRTPGARRVWTVVAGAVLLVSLAGPSTAVTPAATVVLVMMHGLVGGILIWGLRRTSPR